MSALFRSVAFLIYLAAWWLTGAPLRWHGRVHRRRWPRWRHAFIRNLPVAALIGWSAYRWWSLLIAAMIGAVGFALWFRGRTARRLAELEQPPTGDAELADVYDVRSERFHAWHALGGQPTTCNACAAEVAHQSGAVT